MDEWKIDASGRRYKELGRGCREYEGDFVASDGTVPEGTAGHVQKVDITPERQETAKTCPFQRGIPCRKDCALRKGDGCGIGTGKGTEGGRCPFSSLACSSDCGLFRDGGCGLLGIG